LAEDKDKASPPRRSVRTICERAGTTGENGREKGNQAIDVVKLALQGENSDAFDFGTGGKNRSGGKLKKGGSPNAFPLISSLGVNMGDGHVYFAARGTALGLIGETFMNVKKENSGVVNPSSF